MKVLRIFGLLAVGTISVALAAIYGIYEIFKPL